ADGEVTLVDCMSQRTDATQLVRLVVGKRGNVPMHMHLVLRFDYGSIVPWVQRTDTGIRAIAGPDAVGICAPVELHGENLTTVADFTVQAGEQVPFVMCSQPSTEAPHCPQPAD